jgi:hypothetical protein
VKAELSYENYGPWFRSQSPEVRKDLQARGLTPEAVQQEVERLAALGRRTKEYQTKVVYLAFYYSSDPSTRKTLVENGLVDPQDDHGVVKSNRGEHDLAESNLLRTESVEAHDSEGDVIAEALDLSDDAAAQIRDWIEAKVAEETEKRVSASIQRIVSVFLSAPNVRIAAGGLAFAAQLSALNGIGTQTEYARKIGVSKGAISKSTRFWKELLNLPSNPHMKSDPACESYSKAQSTSHWRKKLYGIAPLQ